MSRRIPSDTDFHEDVPNIGTFSFARRSMRDELKIATEYSRLTEGVATPTTWLATVAGWISTLSVLTVTAPDGWNLEAMDPLDEDVYIQIGQVHKALRAREGQFRKGKGADSQAPGQEPRTDA